VRGVRVKEDWPHSLTPLDVAQPIGLIDWTLIRPLAQRLLGAYHATRSPSTDRFEPKAKRDQVEPRRDFALPCGSDGLVRVRRRSAAAEKTNLRSVDGRLPPSDYDLNVGLVGCDCLSHGDPDLVGGRSDLIFSWHAGSTTSTRLRFRWYLWRTWPRRVILLDPFPLSCQRGRTTHRREA